MKLTHFHHFAWANVLSRMTIVLLTISCIGCAIEQPKFEVTATSTAAALVRGDVKEALAFYEARAQEAEKSAEASWFPQQYWEAATWAYIEASRSAGYTGQLQKQVQHASKALETADKTKHAALRVYALIMLDRAYRSVRNFDKARESIDKGLEIVKQIPQNTDARLHWEGELDRQLGTDLSRRSEFSQAIEVLSKGISFKEMLLSGQRRPSEGVQRNLALNLMELGTAYRRNRKFNEALDAYERAASILREVKRENPFETDLRLGIGEIHLQQENFPQALEDFQKALTLARSPGAITWANAGIGYALRQLGKPEEALPYYRRATEQIETVRSLLESPDYRQSYFEGVVGTYTRAILAHIAAKQWHEAFDYSERARSRAFLDVLGTRAQLSKTRSGLMAEEKALNERIAELKARLAAEAEEADPANLRGELREAEKAYNGFLTKVSKENKEQASLMSVTPLTSKQVQELVDPETTLVSYFITNDAVRIWIIEKDKLHYVRVPVSKKDLSNLIKELRETIFSLGERERFKQVSETLYKNLIEPLLPHITGKQLIIVPHDVLHYLPFHALVGSDGRYLIEKYPVYYLSSASLLQFVKEKRKAGGERVLAFGNPDLGDPEKNLEYAELEAQEVKAVYPEASVFLKQEASEEKSKSLSPTHDILHFATHAQLNEDDPLSSAVLLAKEDKEDGRLEVREIFGMDLKANLVVLSGCDTGLGKLSTGDELVGLTRAFIYAGTSSVVASLWSVDDSSTAQLMASFYRNLKTMSKVEALRQAQLEMIRGDGRSDLQARRGVGGIGKLGDTPEPRSPSENPISISTSHPYFWAPFILVGDGK